MPKKKKTKFVCQASKGWEPDIEGGLALMQGEYYLITKTHHGGWWYGKSVLGEPGWVPPTYLTKVEGFEHKFPNAFPKHAIQSGMLGVVGNTPPVFKTPERRAKTKKHTKQRSSLVERRKQYDDPLYAKEQYKDGLKDAEDLVNDPEFLAFTGGKPTKTKTVISGTEAARKQRASLQARSSRQASQQQGSSRRVPENFDFDGKELIDFIFDEFEEDNENPVRGPEVCFALEKMNRELATDAEKCEEFVDSGGLDVVLEVLEKYCNNEQRNELTCLQCLRSMSKLKSFEETYAEANPFPILLSKVDTYKEDPEILGIIFFIMNNLATIPPMRKLMANDNQMLDTVLMFMGHSDTGVKQNAMSVLASMSIDQQHVFDEQHIHRLIALANVDEPVFLRNVLVILVNLSSLEAVVQNMVRAGVFPWISTLVDQTDRQVRQALTKVIRNMFTHNAALGPQEICILFAKLARNPKYTDTNLDCITKYAMKTNEKWEFLRQLIITETLEKLIGYVQEEGVLFLCKIIAHLVTTDPLIKSKNKSKDVYKKQYKLLQLLLKSEVLHMMLQKSDGKKVILGNLKIIMVLVNGNKEANNQSLLLGKYMDFVSEMIDLAMMYCNECLNAIIRICFYLSSHKIYHKKLLEMNVLQFCGVITSSHPQRLVKLFLGLIVRICRAVQTEPSVVGKMLLADQTKLEGFLTSISDEKHEQMTKLALRLLEKLRNKYNQNPALYEPKSNDDTDDDTDSDSEDYRTTDVAEDMGDAAYSQKVDIDQYTFTPGVANFSLMGASTLNLYSMNSAKSMDDYFERSRLSTVSAYVGSMSSQRGKTETPPNFADTPPLYQSPSNASPIMSPPANYKTVPITPPIQFSPDAGAAQKSQHRERGSFTGPVTSQRARVSMDQEEVEEDLESKDSAKERSAPPQIVGRARQGSRKPPPPARKVKAVKPPNIRRKTSNAPPIVTDIGNITPRTLDKTRGTELNAMAHEDAVVKTPKQSRNRASNFHSFPDSANAQNDRAESPEAPGGPLTPKNAPDLGFQALQLNGLDFESCELDRATLEQQLEDHEGTEYDFDFLDIDDDLWEVENDFDLARYLEEHKAVETALFDELFNSLVIQYGLAS